MIGSAVAAQLAAPEVGIGLHYYRNDAAAHELAVRVEAAGALCAPMQCDLADETACGELIERFHERFGTISGVALCAGTVPWQAWGELDTSAWHRALFEHCIAPFMIARAAAGKMSSGGRIVFLSSIAPKYGGSSKSLHYAAAKGALEATMRGLARELAPAGVCVNAVRAGFVDTPQQRSGRTPEEIRKRVGRIPAGRAGTPAEVASALVYLLSQGASFVNGEIITVAGGD
jgi:NAD(P)-dependent dehydrogenase (short-subunit alcohol dehydrogenase family)